MKTSFTLLTSRAWVAAMTMVMPPIHMTTVWISSLGQAALTPIMARLPPMSMKSLMRPRMELFSSTEDM